MTKLSLRKLRSQIIIYQLKDKTGIVNDIGNYRGITLSPVISKLFEVVILSLCSDMLKTDLLQFGFKDKIGTTDAVFTMLLNIL